jgi:hypothetical protein
MTRRKPHHVSQETWEAVDSPELDAAFIIGMKLVARGRVPQKPTNRATTRHRGPGGIIEPKLDLTE